GDDDARYAALVLLDGGDLGVGVPAPRGRREVVSGRGPVRGSSACEQIHGRAAGRGHSDMAAGGAPDAGLSAAPAAMVRGRASAARVPAGAALQRSPWLGEL